MLVLALPHRFTKTWSRSWSTRAPSCARRQQQGVFIRSGTLIDEGPTALFGEAHHRRASVLAWDRVLRDAQSPHDGHNLVYHEFAHKLDMLDGDPDGTPPLASKRNARAGVKSANAPFSRCARAPSKAAAAC